MAHREHNRSRGSGGFFMILFGALMFVTAPLYLQDSPELGALAIGSGFAVGGLGFYLRFARRRGDPR